MNDDSDSDSDSDSSTGAVGGGDSSDKGSSGGGDGGTMEINVEISEKKNDIMAPLNKIRDDIPTRK